MAISVLFLGKKNNAASDAALQFLKERGADCAAYLREGREPMPAECLEWEGDYIFTFLTLWIVPAELLGHARRACLNFHPGPPEYPGVGCVNFALYEGAQEFGATCHHMEPKVDSGKIVAVKRFPIVPEDTVLSVTERCYDHLLSIFREVVGTVLEGGSIPECDETWKRAATTRKQLNELCRVTLDMDEAEVRRRIRATTYPGMPGAELEFQGFRFIYDPPSDE